MVSELCRETVDPLAAQIAECAKVEALTLARRQKVLDVDYYATKMKC